MANGMKNRLTLWVKRLQEVVDNGVCCSEARDQPDMFYPELSPSPFLYTTSPRARFERTGVEYFLAVRARTLARDRLGDESVNDLTKLSNISDDFIVTCLRERFMTDIIYANVGSSCLVAFNPHKHVASNADSVLHEYAAEYRNTTLNMELQPPHIFQSANNAYHHMERTTQDQAIVYSSETSFGKSESRRLAIKTILELSVSNPGKKGSKLASQVPAADFVLESFGNARTLFNPNTSRFGKYPELQFLRSEQLKATLKTIGFSKRHVAQTCQLLAAILHLGNLESTVDRHRNEDAAVVRNTDVCGIIADFLSVQQSKLEACLSYKSSATV
ncbi:hypothetical protein PQX77_019538 [Marasmius sp. AFHP31]|nr:hypothetical protein PQX77_019538 [Marasmius sp. AFHP31]